MTVLIWIVLSILVGAYSQSRSLGFGWGFWWSIFLSPLIGLLITAFSRPNPGLTERNALSTGDLRKCPACAELVKREALKCKHCGDPLPPLNVIRPTPPVPTELERADAQQEAPPLKQNWSWAISACVVVAAGLVIYFAETADSATAAPEGSLKFPEEISLARTIPHAIGHWMWNYGPGSVLTVSEENGQPILTEEFKGTHSLSKALVLKMRETDSPAGRRFVVLENLSKAGDMYTLLPSGDLEVRDNEGAIGIAKSLR